MGSQRKVNFQSEAASQELCRELNGKLLGLLRRRNQWLILREGEGKSLRWIQISNISQVKTEILNARSSGTTNRKAFLDQISVQEKMGVSVLATYFFAAIGAAYLIKGGLARALNRL
ncbi:MAG: hypothetical protein S4CHLAM102_09690 [Chlamydiia bacterium]|nr:hypothetical protein [Chlamydiia bacterium]